MPCLKTSPTPSKGFPSDYRARRHVNNTKLHSVQAALAAAIVLLIAACATTPPDPRMLDNARQALVKMTGLVRIERRDVPLEPNRKSVV